MKKIIIGICTYNRNELLDNALKHIDKLTIPNETEIEVVLVDNNPDLKAKAVYERNLSETNLQLHYYSETKKSIAAVRNKALKEAINLNADYIAFMDDDEYPSQNWLSDLYKTMNGFEADVVTNHQIQCIDGKPCYDPTLVLDRRKTGETRSYSTTASVLFKKEIVTESKIWFDESYGLMTGEDIDFFDRARQKGYKIVWCSEAIMYEIVTQDRQGLNWALDRYYNNGYLKIFKRKREHQNITLLLIKTLLELMLYSFFALLTVYTHPEIKNRVLMKLWELFGKMNSIFKSEAHENYKRD